MMLAKPHKALDSAHVGEVFGGAVIGDGRAVDLVLQALYDAAQPGAALRLVHRTLHLPFATEGTVQVDAPQANMSLET